MISREISNLRHYHDQPFDKTFILSRRDTQIAASRPKLASKISCVNNWTEDSGSWRDLVVDGYLRGNEDAKLINIL